MCLKCGFFRKINIDLNKTHSSYWMDISNWSPHLNCRWLLTCIKHKNNPNSSQIYRSWAKSWKVLWGKIRYALNFLMFFMYFFILVLSISMTIPDKTYTFFKIVFTLLETTCKTTIQFLTHT